MEQALSILIVNYNGASYLEPCISSFQSFLQKHGVAHEFLIIDNASADNSRAEMERLAATMPNVAVHFSEVNLGFGKANNELAKLAKYETLVLLNNDTLTVQLSALCELIKSSTLDPRTVYTCTLLNSDHSLQKNTFNFPRLFNVAIEVFLIKKLIFDLYKLLFKAKLVIEDGYFSGCYLVLPKALFVQAGGFDEDFFFYHEECDLFLRLEKLGIQKKILGDQIIHYGSGGAGISDFAFKQYYQNLARLLIKHGYGSVRFIQRLFSWSFNFRIVLLKMGINIPYSPFSHIYDKNKTIAVNRQHLITLHRETLEAINSLKLNK